MVSMQDVQMLAVICRHHVIFDEKVIKIQNATIHESTTKPR